VFYRRRALRTLLSAIFVVLLLYLIDEKAFRGRLPVEISVPFTIAPLIGPNHVFVNFYLIFSDCVVVRVVPDIILLRLTFLVVFVTFGLMGRTAVFEIAFSLAVPRLFGSQFLVRALSLKADAAATLVQQVQACGLFTCSKDHLPVRILGRSQGIHDRHQMLLCKVFKEV
jgi:hypothetical protein